MDNNLPCATCAHNKGLRGLFPCGFTACICYNATCATRLEPAEVEALKAENERLNATALWYHENYTFQQNRAEAAEKALAEEKKRADVAERALEFVAKRICSYSESTGLGYVIRYDKIPPKCEDCLFADICESGVSFVKTIKQQAAAEI